MELRSPNKETGDNLLWINPVMALAANALLLAIQTWVKLIVIEKFKLVDMFPITNKSPKPVDMFLTKEG